MELEFMKNAKKKIFFETLNFYLFLNVIRENIEVLDLQKENQWTVIWNVWHIAYTFKKKCSN